MGATSSGCNQMCFGTKAQKSSPTSANSRQYSQERGQIHQFSPKFTAHSGPGTVPTSMAGNQGWGRKVEKPRRAATIKANGTRLD